MNHAQQRLVVICDDLLRAISEHRRIKGISAAAETSALIDRVLDIRNAIKQSPQPQPTNQPK